MNPILFPEAATEFNTNGIGRLSDAISCKVTEERNGIYELEMEYPITGQHYSDIGIRKLIVVVPYVGASLQPFRIYQISKPISGRVLINAHHISYDLSKNTVMPFTVYVSLTSCYDALQGLKTNAVEACPFTFWTNNTTVASYQLKTPASIRSQLGGVEGSILDQFHGEYEWDKFTVKLHNARGSDNGVVLRYGKNLTDLKQEENIATTITGIVPYWSDPNGDEVVTLPEKVLYSPNASAYSSKLTVPLDFSGDYQEKPTVEMLRAAGQAYINAHDLGIPKVSIDVSFVNLADTEEYQDDMAALQTVKLCDTVKVQFEELGVSATAKVVRYEWDVLGEKYLNLTIGSLRSSLAETINDQNVAVKTELKKNLTQAGTAIAEATVWMTSGNGYICAIKDDVTGEWKELLAMDSPDIDTAEKIIRINENGIGGSSTGIDGPYLAAMLSDGTIVADRMKTGILTDLNGKFSLNMNTGELYMKDGTFVGTINGSVINFGQQSPTGSFIIQGTLTWGDDMAGSWYGPKMTSEDSIILYASSDPARYNSEIVVSSGGGIFIKADSINLQNLHSYGKINVSSDYTDIVTCRGNPGTSKKKLQLIATLTGLDVYWNDEYYGHINFDS